MRLTTILFATVIALGTVACNRTQAPEDRAERERRTDENARKAGQEAYRLTEKTKEAAKEAAEKLQKAAHEARQGWEEEKHKDQTRTDR